jgi:tRNA(Ile)-lysidine synthetase-like protein
MTTMHPIETIDATLRAHQLIPEGALIVVGVSGGTDSLALLHMLHARGVRLHVATLDHGLRGQAGEDDARFVVETTRTWGIPVTSRQANVGALAHEKRMSIEAAARHARYDFLASVAREVGADRVAVAHNADDQVETVLLHLLRGAGMGGSAGMAYSAPVPGHPALTLIRPLLDTPRAALEAYCREHKLQPRHDATNEDTSYTRNRLRRETIPNLNLLFPQFGRRLRQLAEIAALENDFTESSLQAAIAPYIEKEADRIRLPRETFAALHPALQRRFVLWAARLLDPTGDVGYVHLVAAVRLALEGQVGSIAQLRGGVQLRVDYAHLVVEREGAPLHDDLPLLGTAAEIPVAIPGVTPINRRWSLLASLDTPDGESYRLVIPNNSAVRVRGRRAGDRFAPLGMGGHTRKLSEWMVDRKVPKVLRDHVPLLVVDGTIAAIFWNGATINGQFAVHTGEERIIYFRVSNLIDHIW